MRVSRALPPETSTLRPSLGPVTLTLVGVKMAAPTSPLTSDKSLNTSNTSPTSPKSPTCPFYVKADSVEVSSDHIDHVDPSYRPKLLKHSGTSLTESADWGEGNLARLLVLYTGGTIGMRSQAGGKTRQ